MHTLPFLALLIAALLLSLVAVVLGGRRRFRALVNRGMAELRADPGPAIGAEQLAARIDSLPEPVRRHLRFALPPGAQVPRIVRLKHAGHFRVGRRWLPIRGEELFTLLKAGFVWNARVQAAPLVWIEARDALLGGKGSMLVKLLSTWTIVGASGPEIDQSAAGRWLVEMTWCPWALGGDAIRWEPIDSHSARAVLAGDGPAVAAVMEIDGQGRIIRWTTDRYREVAGGRTVLTPWIGRCSEYREFRGVLVPEFVEGSWQLSDGEFSYVRFRVTAMEFDPAPPGSPP